MITRTRRVVYSSSKVTRKFIYDNISIHTFTLFNIRIYHLFTYIYPIVEHEISEHLVCWIIPTYIYLWLVKSLIIIINPLSKHMIRLCFVIRDILDDVIDYVSQQLWVVFLCWLVGNWFMLTCLLIGRFSIQAGDLISFGQCD